MTPAEEQKYKQHQLKVEMIEVEIDLLKEKIAQLEEARSKHVEVMWALDGRTLYKRNSTPAERTAK